MVLECIRKGKGGVWKGKKPNVQWSQWLTFFWINWWTTGISLFLWIHFVWYLNAQYLWLIRMKIISANFLLTYIKQYKRWIHTYIDGTQQPNYAIECVRRMVVVEVVVVVDHWVVGLGQSHGIFQCMHGGLISEVDEVTKTVAITWLSKFVVVMEGECRPYPTHPSQILTDN